MHKWQHPMYVLLLCKSTTTSKLANQFWQTEFNWKTVRPFITFPFMLLLHKSAKMEYLSQRFNGLPNLKYLLSDPLHKKLTELCCIGNLCIDLSVFCESKQFQCDEFLKVIWFTSPVHFWLPLFESLQFVKVFAKCLFMPSPLLILLAALCYPHFIPKGAKVSQVKWVHLGVHSFHT